MRAHNERLILSLIRANGSLAKADIAKQTGLSAQTISVIIRELEAEGLLLRGEPVRGKVGQPLVPMTLNPDGAYYFGLKVGRRTAQLVLIDLLGGIRDMRELDYRYPTPALIRDFTRQATADISAALGEEPRGRIAGLGIALPFQLWNWADSVGASDADLEAWREADLRAVIAQVVDFPVYLQNDATAACGAELAFGKQRAEGDFVYFYVGSFIGGGVVLNGRLYSGRSGNAGALGSMPVARAGEAVSQLIDLASLSSLEQALLAAEQPCDWIRESPQDWGELSPLVLDWVDKAGQAIAYAIVSSTAVIDFEAAVVDGWIPADVRRLLVESTRRHIREFDLDGLNVPVVREGSIGIHARAIGGASLPLSERFLIGRIERQGGN
ncbi:ROK family transcriptional regulator [Granulosicoccaceae sp. 1_MG-2023]|nr:ROK family transcriptional regulator [Granulosicoccaceae sp. 1_MG-2023]